MEKSPTLYECYSDMTAGKKLLVKPTYISDEEYAKKWKEEIYHTKGIDENMPEIITNNGEKVRSKSEKIIADTLEKNAETHNEPLDIKVLNSIINEYFI